MSNQITDLSTSLSKLKSEVDNIKNRGLIKTLIFRNIPQIKNKESSEETKVTLAKKIKVIIRDVAYDMIISKI